MEDKFPGDYIVAHSRQLLEMLEAAEELPLFHEPSVLVETLGEDATESRVESQALAAYEPETPEGIEADTMVRLGKMRLISLRGRAIMHLFTDYLENSGVDYSAMAEGEREKSFAIVSSQVGRQLDAANGKFTRTNFVNTETDELIGVESVSFENQDSPFVARELIIEIQDSMLKRTITVDQIAWKDGPVAGLEVSQSIVPLEDPEIVAMAQFFIVEHDDPDTHNLLIGAFADYLVGGEPAELDTARGKYSGADAEKFESFVDLMRQRAENYRAQHELFRNNPDLDRPTSAELDEYLSLLQQARS